MGQQQLLLLVLGIVIVGLAVVVGIQAFNENRQKSEIDRYTGMGVEMVGDIIAWYMKPQASGGGNQSAANFAGLSIDQIGYRNDLEQSGGWGFRSGTIENGTQRFLTISSSGNHPFFHIHPDPVATGMVRVEVHVFGPRPECIVTRHDLYGVSETWSDGSETSALPSNPNPALCSW